MELDTGNLHVRLADSAADRRGAARLRYRVFVEELGGGGPGVDHAERTEADRFDAFCDHLIVADSGIDPASGDHVVGVYRLMRADQAARAGGFYSEREYDLGVLRDSGRRLLELGRSCVDPGHRGGGALLHLWTGLADYVTRHEFEVLFGVASFHGTDPAAFADALAHLHAAHLAPAALRPTARPGGAHRMDLVPGGVPDRVRAMRQMPALIKAYLRLGGWVGEGAWIDRDFNTTDVCLVLETSRINEKRRAIYAGGAG